MSRNTDNARLVAIVLGSIGAVVVFPMLFMGVGPMGLGAAGSGSMMGGMWGGGMWGDGTMAGWTLVVSIVLQLLFLAAIIGGGYLVYRAVAGTEGEPDRALEELRVAYARGELTDEEFEQRRAALEGDPGSR